MNFPLCVSSVRSSLVRICRDDAKLVSAKFPYICTNLSNHGVHVIKIFGGNSNILKIKFALMSEPAQKCENNQIFGKTKGTLNLLFLLKMAHSCSFN